jgi:hypothetical protein
VWCACGPDFTAEPDLQLLRIATSCAVPKSLLSCPTLLKLRLTCVGPASFRLYNGHRAGVEEDRGAAEVEERLPVGLNGSSSAHCGDLLESTRLGDDSSNATARPWRGGVHQQARHGRCWFGNGFAVGVPIPPTASYFGNHRNKLFLVDTPSNVASRGRAKSFPPAVPPACILVLIPCFPYFELPLFFIQPAATRLPSFLLRVTGWHRF